MKVFKDFLREYRPDLSEQTITRIIAKSKASNPETILTNFLRYFV